VRHVVGGRKGDPVPRDRLPSRAGQRAFGAEGIPAAILLAEAVDDGAHVDETGLEQERIGVAEDDEVMAGLAVGLGGPLGWELEALYVTGSGARA
jgi:hypothetical protein